MKKLAVPASIVALALTSQVCRAQETCPAWSGTAKVSLNRVQSLPANLSGRAIFAFQSVEDGADAGVVIDVVRRSQTFDPAGALSTPGETIRLSICREGGSVPVYPANLDALQIALGAQANAAMQLPDGQRFGMNLGAGRFVAVVEAGSNSNPLEVFIRPRPISRSNDPSNSVLAFESTANRLVAERERFPIPTGSVAVFRFATDEDPRRNATISLTGLEDPEITEQRNNGGDVAPRPDPVLRLLERTQDAADWTEVASNDDSEGLDSKIAYSLKPDTEYAIAATSLNGIGEYVLKVDRAATQPFQPQALNLREATRGELSRDTFGSDMQTREKIFALNNLPVGRYELLVQDLAVIAELGVDNPFGGQSRNDRFLPAKSLGETATTGRVFFTVSQAGNYLLSLRDRQTPFDSALSGSGSGDSAGFTATLRPAAAAAPRR